MKATGAHMLRGGAFKPRTSPYAFQGLGLKGRDDGQPLWPAAARASAGGGEPMSELVPPRGINGGDEAAGIPQADAVELEVFKHLFRGRGGGDGRAVMRPRTRPTSRSGATSRARCSTPTGRCSPRRRTSRYTWARCRWRVACWCAIARRDAARRRLRGQRPVRRWHAPAGHYRRRAAGPGRARQRRVSSPPTARTTPTSAGSARARCR